MSDEPPPAFAPGDAVRIVDLGKPGHVRTPRYTRGKTGIVERYCGAFDNPENRGYGRVGQERISLYRVRLRQRDLWPDYEGPAHDTLELEIYEHWLQPVSEADQRVS